MPREIQRVSTHRPCKVVSFYQKCFPEFIDVNSCAWIFDRSRLPLCRSFLDRIHEIQADDYIPTDQVSFKIEQSLIKRTIKEAQCPVLTVSVCSQDMLRCRVITNTVQTIDFAVKDRRATVNFR